MRAALLGLHVLAGGAALLLAAVLLLRGGWGGRRGAAYVVAVVVVCGSAVLLAGPGSALPVGARGVLCAVAAVSAWAAVTGRAREVAGPRGGRRRLDGSVVSLVTAVAVVSAPAAVWVAVAAAGTVLAEVAEIRRARPLSPALP